MTAAKPATHAWLEVFAHHICPLDEPLHHGLGFRIAQVELDRHLPSVEPLGVVLEAVSAAGAAATPCDATPAARAGTRPRGHGHGHAARPATGSPAAAAPRSAPRLWRWPWQSRITSGDAACAMLPRTGRVGADRGCVNAGARQHTFLMSTQHARQHGLYCDDTPVRHRSSARVTAARAPTWADPR